jgi:hypothetical protein
VATAWLYRYVLLSDLDRYLADGWRVGGTGPTLGGWASMIVIKRIFFS